MNKNVYISEKWMKMSEIYKQFSDPSLDFSKQSLIEQYLYESRGIEFSNDKNGYSYGKKMLDITIKMWRKDIKSGLLFRFELEDEFPSWFLDKVLGKQ